METGSWDRPEGNLAYTVYGEGGAQVLMLPGMGALRSEYRFLGPRLAEAGYRPVSADLRGHGDSSVPWPDYDVPAVGRDIVGLIEHLAAGPSHVIATSFAAGSAVWAAAERPDLVRSLVLVGAFVRDVEMKLVMRAGAWLLMNNPWRVRTWITYYRTLYPSQKPPDFDEYLVELRRNLAEPGRFDAAKALANSSRQPSEDRLTRLRVPTLIMMGTSDGDFPDATAEGRFIAEQTGGEFELVEGAGHYPQTEFPDRVAPIIIDFLGRVSD